MGGSKWLYINVIINFKVYADMLEKLPSSSTENLYRDGQKYNCVVEGLLSIDALPQFWMKLFSQILTYDN